MSVSVSSSCRKYELTSGTELYILLYCTVDMNSLYAKMFPDSNIAKKFASAHTKTTCILNEAIMPSLHEYIVTYMKTNMFAFVNDGSSDTGINKMNPACALIFDVNNSNKVCFKFFDMCPTTGEDCCKAETLFNAIDSALEHEGISWGNCVSMGVDNTNSNVGEHNSLKSRILTKNPCRFIAGCSCHLAHLAAGKGGKSYTLTSGFDMEQHQVDFLLLLQKKYSSKRNSF